MMIDRDLSNLLWADLTTDDERIRFLESGRAWETGIIAQSMVPDVIVAFKARRAIVRAAAELGRRM